MRTIFALVLLLATPLLAQTRPESSGPPAPAVLTGPAFEASLGYTYFSMAGPSSQRVAFSGVSADALVRSKSLWGLTVESSYARTGNVLGTGHSGSILSCLAGPVLYPAERGKTKFYVRALAGISRVDSAVPVSSTDYLAGWESRFSYAVGGGVEQNLPGPLALRAGADYQRMMFIDSTATTQFQNNLRLTTSIVYRFGNR
jgi:opacity protein-like surface antigen